MRPRGAFPSPRHRLAAATPHKIIGATPSQFLWKPSQLSMWLNNVYGDCVTAEEAFAKACNNPEIFITDQTVKDWAAKNSALYGADLISILDLMQSNGFPQDGKLYNDGDPIAVNWTDPEILQNAIAQGPVKIGVAANQLESAVPEPPVNGWIATGFQKDLNEDHCVSLPGFGPISYLCKELGSVVPDSIDPSKVFYALFTWSSIGIIEWDSLQAICAEAWLRNPTTIIK